MHSTMKLDTYIFILLSGSQLAIFTTYIVEHIRGIKDVPPPAFCTPICIVVETVIGTLLDYTELEFHKFILYLFDN